MDILEVPKKDMNKSLKKIYENTFFSGKKWKDSSRHEGRSRVHKETLSGAGAGRNVERKNLET